ncbi:MAG TPA: hypothetical protein VGG45_18975 [Terracidiphilus sp.]|jgi:hypothetical protein
MLKYFLAFVLFAFSPFLQAQLSLRNADVIHMVKAGLGEDLIITTIDAAPGYYDTSIDGLANLQRAGVSDKEMSSIVQKAFHICFAGTVQDHLEGLKQGQMEELLQKFRCGPHSDRPPPPAAKASPVAEPAPNARMFHSSLAGTLGAA